MGFQIVDRKGGNGTILAQHHRSAFHPDGVIRRQGAAGGEVPGIRTAGKSGGFRAGFGQGEHGTSPGPRNGPADGGKPPEISGVQRGLGQCHHLRTAAAVGEGIFGFGDQLDHALVTFLGGLPESEDPVVHQDQAFHLAPVGVLDQFAHRFGEEKSGHDVRHHDDAVAPGFPDEGGSVRLIRQGDHGIGMGVIHKPVREHGVDHGLDAWVRA